MTKPSDLAKAQHNLALQRAAEERRQRALEMLDEHPDLHCALFADEYSLRDTVILALSPWFHDIQQTISCECRSSKDKCYPYVFPEMPGSTKVH